MFNKRLKEEDKKEGLLKRLKDIEANQNSINNDKAVQEVNQLVMMNLKVVFILLV